MLQAAKNKRKDRDRVTWINTAQLCRKINFERALTGILGNGGYQILGAAMFCVMGWNLYRIATRKTVAIVEEELK